MTTGRISRLTAIVILLQASLVLVSFSRGDCGSLLVLVMCPFVGVALIPSVLAFLGASFAAVDRKASIGVLVLTCVMVVPALIDLAVPLEHKGYDPELEPAGRAVFLVCPCQTCFAFLTLALGIAGRMHARQQGMRQSPQEADDIE
jgi:hypothetical protein